MAIVREWEETLSLALVLKYLSLGMGVSNGPVLTLSKC